MCDCNELFIEKRISIDHSNKAIESIEQHNKEMDEAVIVTLDKNIHAIDLEKTGDRYGEDTFLDATNSSDRKTNNGLLMTEACIVKGVEHHNYGNKRFSKSLNDTMKSKKSDKKCDDLKTDNVKTNGIKDEQSNSKKEDDHVWPIMREDDPGCEWTDNDEIVGGSFSFPFFKGAQDAS